MSSPQSQRSRLLHTIVHVLERELSTRTLQFHATLAERLGINMTDYKALEMTNRHHELTASALAEHLGLTAGAITGIVDRLERAGLVQRAKARVDRRQVYILPIPERQHEVQQLFAFMDTEMMALTERYSDAELTLIDAYLRESIAVVQAATAHAHAGGRRDTETPH